MLLNASQTLQSARLTLRQPRRSDLPQYVAYCASPRTQFVGGPFGAPQAFEKLASMIGHWALRGFGRYVITHEDVPIGHVGPMQIDATQPPEMTWTLWRADAEGQGFAFEAANAVRDHLFADLDWPGLRILIQPENHASCRIAEKLGAVATDTPAPPWFPGARSYALRAEALT